MRSRREASRSRSAVRPASRRADPARPRQLPTGSEPDRSRVRPRDRRSRLHHASGWARLAPAPRLRDRRSARSRREGLCRAPVRSRLGLIVRFGRTHEAGVMNAADRGDPQGPPATARSVGDGAMPHPASLEWGIPQGACPRYRFRSASSSAVGGSVGTTTARDSETAHSRQCDFAVESSSCTWGKHLRPFRDAFDHPIEGEPVRIAA